MSFIIVDSQKNPIQYYVRRVSTTRNGVKGSYPVFSSDVEVAHRFTSFVNASKSKALLEDQEKRAFAIINSDEIEAQGFNNIRSDDVVFVEDADEADDQADDQTSKTHDSRTLVPISSELSMIAKTDITIVRESGQEANFTTAHKLFAYAKAVWAGDVETADKIVYASDISEITRLSREVKIEDVSEYDQAKDELMYYVLSHRFKQDPDFADALMSTGNSKIVVLSTNDYWGDNYGKGQNKLGHVLENLRDDIKKEL